MTADDRSSNPWASPTPEAAGPPPAAPAAPTVAMPPVPPAAHAPEPVAGPAPTAPLPGWPIPPQMPGIPLPPAGYPAQGPAGLAAYPPAYPPGFPPGFPPLPPRRARSGGALVALIVSLSLILVGGLTAAGFAVARTIDSSNEASSASPTPTATASPSPAPSPLAEGDCVTGSAREYVKLACPGGTHKVIAAPYDASHCPPETDEIGEDSYNNQPLCLLSHQAPHPGAPGGGGGVLRAGDCLPNVDTEGMIELPCAAGKAYHKIVALAPAAAKCAPPAVRQFAAEKPASEATKILCLADAGGIASPGECVAFPGDRIAPSYVPVPCTTRPAMKFTGRVPKYMQCGKWSNSFWYVEPPEALPAVKFNCYKKLG